MILFVLLLLLLLGSHALFAARPFSFVFGRTGQKTAAQPNSGASLRNILTDDVQDCAYDLIWRTQLPALQFLRRVGSGGASPAEMRKFYWDFGRRYPEFADGSYLQTWLDALQDAGVAVHCSADDRIAITEKGQHLLDILEQGVPII